MNQQQLKVLEKRKFELNTRTRKPMVTYPKGHHSLYYPYAEPVNQTEQEAEEKTTY